MTEDVRPQSDGLVDERFEHLMIDGYFAGRTKAEARHGNKSDGLEGIVDNALTRAKLRSIWWATSELAAALRAELAARNLTIAAAPTSGAQKEGNADE